MLEAAGFDFRNRYPQKLLVKIAKLCEFDGQTCKIAYKMCLDLYRTFAPLKQTASTMALACVELAARLHGSLVDRDLREKGIDYDKWHTTRAEVMGKLSSSEICMVRCHNQQALMLQLYTLTLLY